MAFSCEIMATILSLEDLLCSKNSGNVLHSDLWQLPTHVRARVSYWTWNARTFSGTSVSLAFVCFLQNFGTLWLKETDIPVKCQAFCLNLRGPLAGSSREEIFTHFYTQAASTTLEQWRVCCRGKSVKRGSSFSVWPCFLEVELLLSLYSGMSNNVGPVISERKRRNRWVPTQVEGLSVTSSDAGRASVGNTPF